MMAIKIVEELKQLRSNTYEHDIPIEEHVCSRAIKAIEHMARGLDAQAAEIERLENKVWILQKAALEDGCSVEVGPLTPQTED